MARKVRQIRRKGKAIGIVPAPATATAAPDWNTRIALIQALIPVALEKVEEELQADVARLASERYVRDGRLPGHVRWTPQRGSIYLGDQKIPIEVPRVRERLGNTERESTKPHAGPVLHGLAPAVRHVITGVFTAGRRIVDANKAPVRTAMERKANSIGEMFLMASVGLMH